MNKLATLTVAALTTIAATSGFAQDHGDIWGAGAISCGKYWLTTTHTAQAC